jgi:dGTPase
LVSWGFLSPRNSDHNGDYVRFDDLITPTRLKVSSIPDRDLDTEMLSDKARIVTSTAFRRLQTKAQVFSLERNAAVRTRLTHTLEVAMFGELVAGAVFSLLSKKNLISANLRFPFIQTVENACLLHDIGNPPFGHLGEFAIRDWFDKKRSSVLEAWIKCMPEDTAKHLYEAFLNFDGNAQGFRIVTRLMWVRDQWGLNLTCTLLASILKYLASTPMAAKPFAKKTGFFEAESELVRDVWKNLGLKFSNDLPAQRHPFTFIMEAADDIAYGLSDIEDALEKGIFTEKHLFDNLSPRLLSFAPDLGVASSSQNWARNSGFIIFRTKLNRFLVERAAILFDDNCDGIWEGSLHKPLLDLDDDASKFLDELKGFSKDYIFNSREAIEIELSGFRIIQDILSGFERLLLLSSDDFASLSPDATRTFRYGEKALERRLYAFLPNKYIIGYKFLSANKPLLEPVYRTHLILDYLSGMTDSHAVKIYNMLSGISVGTSL